MVKRRPQNARLGSRVRPDGAGPSQGRTPAFLFDLDGTLVDSTYEHALAWRRALSEAGIDLPTWKVHRQIGMSGGLLVHALLTEMDVRVSPALIERVKEFHSREYDRIVGSVRPLPGAKELLAHLTRLSVPWIIATSAGVPNARKTVAKLGHPNLDRAITRDDVERAKPDPDLFLAAADRLDVPITRSMVVGDSVWDILAARRAGALGVGLLTGGVGRDELEKAGALRVYDSPLDLLKHLHELGVRPSEAVDRVA